MSLHGNVDQTRDVNDSSAYLYKYKSYLSLYLQMVLFFSEQLHFHVGEFVDERLDCGPKYKAIWIPTSPLGSSS